MRAVKFTGEEILRDVQLEDDEYESTNVHTIYSS
jgi:hypothetical protein